MGLQSRPSIAFMTAGTFRQQMLGMTDHAMRGVRFFAVDQMLHRVDFTYSGHGAMNLASTRQMIFGW